MARGELTGPGSTLFPPGPLYFLIGTPRKNELPTCSRAANFAPLKWRMTVQTVPRISHRTIGETEGPNWASCTFRPVPRCKQGAACILARVCGCVGYCCLVALCVFSPVSNVYKRARSLVLESYSLCLCVFTYYVLSSPTTQQQQQSNNNQ